MKKSLVLITACWLGLGACDGSEPVAPDAHPIPIETLLDGAIVVTRNPNGLTPLVAEASFSTTVPVDVSIEVLGPEPLSHEFPGVATEHTIPILGLYPGVANQIEVRLTGPGRGYAMDTIAISTDTLPAFLPTIEVVTADPEAMEDGLNLSSVSIGEGSVFSSYPVMFDTNGDVRWYMDLSSLGGIVFAVERFANGNLRVAQGHKVHEYDMLGTEIRHWDMPGYRFHHDVIEEPNGNLLVAVDKEGLATVEDHVIELDRASGAIVNEWDLRQVLDVNRRDFSTDPVDWFHMNALWYSEADDALIISGRNQGVVKVTRNNELVWILAPHKGWGQNADGDETSEFLLTAIDAEGMAYPESVQQGDEGMHDFRWTWGQHASMLLPNGNLFLFDNGATRNFSQSSPLFSRGVEYVIDESQMTVRQVWEYGEERGPEFHAPIISDVDDLPMTGNRLVMPGIVLGADPRALVTEVTYPGREVVFEAILHLKNMLSTGALAWGNFDLVYRSERLPLYP